MASNDYYGQGGQDYGRDSGPNYGGPNSVYPNQASYPQGGGNNQPAYPQGNSNMPFPTGSNGPGYPSDNYGGRPSGENYGQDRGFFNKHSDDRKHEQHGQHGQHQNQYGGGPGYPQGGHGGPAPNDYYSGHPGQGQQQAMYPTGPNQYGDQGQVGPDGERGLMASLGGGAIGAFAGHKFAGGTFGTIAGAALGAIGANIAEDKIKKKKKNKKEKKNKHGHDRSRGRSSSSSSSSDSD